MDIITMIMACSLYSNYAVVNAMVDINSNNTPLMVSGKVFKTPKTALAYAMQLKNTGTPFQIGLMQIPDHWLIHQPVSLTELLRPCKNMVIATQILNNALNNSCQGSEACALSVYETGDPEAGLSYANQVLQYAKNHPFTPPPTNE